MSRPTQAGEPTETLKCLSGNDKSLKHSSRSQKPVKVDESRKALTVAPEEAAAARSRGVTRTPRTLNPNFDVVVSARCRAASWIELD